MVTVVDFHKNALEIFNQRNYKYFLPLEAKIFKAKNSSGIIHIFVENSRLILSF